jgi:hypothetical protein
MFNASLFPVGQEGQAVAAGHPRVRDRVACP